MAKKTISQALKDLFLGLGGDSSALADNTSASDYIQDLESAIKATASGASEDLIDDTEASSTKTYSSTKIESLIPENELPTPAVGDIGKVVSVVSDGESGAEYDLTTPASDVVYIKVTISGSTVTPPEGVTTNTLTTLIKAGKQVILYNTESNGASRYYYLDVFTEASGGVTMFGFVRVYKKTNTQAGTIQVIHQSIDIMQAWWSLSEVTIYSST